MGFSLKSTGCGVWLQAPDSTKLREASQNTSDHDLGRGDRSQTSSVPVDPLAGPVKCGQAPKSWLQSSLRASLMVKATSAPTLYQQDLVAWYDYTVAKLKAGEFAALDVDALIEEIEGLAGRDRRELKSRLRVLLAHLLKRLYIDAPDDYRGWEITIREQRRQLLDLLEQSPSLRNEVELLFPKCWAEALATVREDYPQTVFPDRWPGSTDLDTLLSEKVW